MEAGGSFAARPCREFRLNARQQQGSAVTAPDMTTGRYPVNSEAGTMPQLAPVRDDSEMEATALRLFGRSYTELTDNQANDVWNEIEENES